MIVIIFKNIQLGTEPGMSETKIAGNKDDILHD
jgi:hypothetical protein